MTEVVENISFGMEEVPRSTFSNSFQVVLILKTVDLNFSLNFDYMTLIYLTFSRFNDLNTIRNIYFNLCCHFAKHQRIFLKCQAHLTEPFFHLLSKTSILLLPEII